MDPHINPATGVWDDNYYAQTQGGGGSGNGAIPAFNFDFDKAARDAYGELGPYYNELLIQSQGDVNKAVSRLVEDYNTGARYKAEDTTKALASVDTAQAQDNKAIVNNALARGLYQTSASDPTAAYGIPDAQMAENTAIRNLQRADINQGQTRFTEAATTDLTRNKTDIAEKQKRYESQLEEQKKQEAAQLANLRGEKAYQKFSASLF